MVLGCTREKNIVYYIEGKLSVQMDDLIDMSNQIN